ncbi:MAG: hypothetical protein AB7Q01_08680 [Gammaproteobacteria bacterium]
MPSAIYVPSDAEMRLWWDRLTDYTPSSGQWPIHRSGSRVRLVAGGERAGKSKLAAMDVLPRIPDADLIWIVGKDYNLARQEFRYLIEALHPAGFIKTLSMPTGLSAPWIMTLVTGCEIRTVTAADEVKLASVAPDGIIMAEAAQQSYDIYLRLRRRTAQKRGWLLLEGTFENSEDWYADLWETWKEGGPEGEQSFSLPTWSNLAVFPGGYDDPEMQLQLRVLGEASFKERFGGIPTPPAEVVFPEFAFETHVGDAPFDSEKPVEIAVDPGYNGAYAVVALQWYGGTLHVIDEVYKQRTPARDVIREVRARPWAKNVNREMAGVIDIAGTQHQGLDSNTEVWAAPARKGGAGWLLRSRFVPIETGIERLRSFLRHPESGEPRIIYHAATTPFSQREFKRYKYPKDKDGRVQREKPIDRDNHALKAVTYWLVDHFGIAGRPVRGTVDARFGSSDGSARPRRRLRHRTRRLAQARFH